MALIGGAEHTELPSSACRRRCGVAGDLGCAKPCGIPQPATEHQNWGWLGLVAEFIAEKPCVFAEVSCSFSLCAYKKKRAFRSFALLARQRMWGGCAAGGWASQHQPAQGARRYAAPGARRSLHFLYGVPVLSWNVSCSLLFLSLYPALLFHLLFFLGLSEHLRDDPADPPTRQYRCCSAASPRSLLQPEPTAALLPTSARRLEEHEHVPMPAPHRAWDTVVPCGLPSPGLCWLPARG